MWLRDWGSMPHCGFIHDEQPGPVHDGAGDFNLRFMPPENFLGIACLVRQAGKLQGPNAHFPLSHDPPAVLRLPKKVTFSAAVKSS